MFDDGKYERYFRTTSMHSRSSATSRSATPETLQCTDDPPISSAVTSSPTAAFTRCGPPSAMFEVPFTIGTKSARPGMYAVPAAPGPIMAATCGTTPDMCTCSRNRSPVRANIEPAASWIRAPPESTSHTMGMRSRRASSRMRDALSSPTMPMDPAITVKSYAMTATRRPSIRPMPVTTPSAGVCLPCMDGACDW